MFMIAVGVIYSLVSAVSERSPNKTNWSTTAVQDPVERGGRDAEDPFD